jgi:hypothetical protein
MTDIKIPEITSGIFQSFYPESTLCVQKLDSPEDPTPNDHNSVVLSAIAEMM